MWKEAGLNFFDRVLVLWMILGREVEDIPPFEEC